MADWTFKDALTGIQIQPSIPTSVLQSADGLCLGDIHFAKICTTLQMHAMPLTLLEKWVDNGGFNPEHMAGGDYSCSTAILLTITPDTQLKDIESVGIRLVVCQHRALLGQISSVPRLISYVCSMLEFERASCTPQCRMYCMIIGNYSGHLAYATDPPFCVAYAFDFVNKKRPCCDDFQEPGQPT